MRYLDTSLLVALITQEAGFERFQPWFENHTPGILHISNWVIAEFSAAVSIKVRVGNFTADQQSRALEIFAGLANNLLTVLPIRNAHFLHAAKLADMSWEGLRAADALHLAIAADCGAELFTLDKRMAKAGRACEVVTFLL